VHAGIIRRKRRIYVGSELNWREKVIKALHDSSLDGHSGIVGTYQRVKNSFIGQNKRKLCCNMYKSVKFIR
jgi:Integrase zinc binding domain